MLLHRGLERDDLDDDAIKCPIREILARTGSRWVLDVMTILDQGPHHFADLDRRIPKISRRMLTLTLRTLERDGLISRRAEGWAGSMVFYEITKLGHGLARHLHALTEWSREHRDAIYAARATYDAILRPNLPR
jgi:DNA-binding HxlR family transcriptional regulator